MAADLGARPYSYNKAPAYVAPLYNWTGFYIGGHVGGAFAGSNNFNGLVLSDYSARFLGGLQAGADYQFAPNWVLGVEGQYSWLGGNYVNATFPGGVDLQQQPARPRLDHRPRRLHLGSGPGLREGRLRLFGQPRHPDLRTARRSRFTLDKNHSNGYTVGAGVEYMFAPNWSAKAEYMYYDFGSTRFVTPGVLVAVRQLAQRRAHGESRRQLPLQPRRPGGRPLLIAFSERLRKRLREKLKRPARCRPFCCLIAIFRIAESPANQTLTAKKVTQRPVVFPTC